LSSSKGAFSLGVGSSVGDTKRSANFRGAYNPSMISVFRNGATLSGIPAAGCAAGTYAAGASDTRLLRVHVTKGSTTETLSPDLVINTVPSAQVAASLQGFLPSDFLRLDVANGISGNIGLTATGVGAGQTREFRFYELAANGAEYSAFKAPDAMSTSLTYVLPSSAPAAGDILKATVPSSGVVTLSWGPDAGAGGGISNFNGSNQSSQSFTAVDIAAAITAPAWSTNTGTGAHTLQIPMAVGTGVTGGLITKAEHTTFSSKVDRAGDTMTGLLNFTGASGISLANTTGITFTGTGTIAMGANKITGVADPSAAQEAATKAYVDSQNSGKIGGTLTATRIPYASGASTLTDSANLTYITGTNQLVLGGNPSTSSLSISGTPSGNATRSLIQLGPSISGGSANGTYVGANPASFTGNFLDLQVGGISYLKVSSLGDVTAGNHYLFNGSNIQFGGGPYITGSNSGWININSGVFGVAGTSLSSTLNVGSYAMSGTNAYGLSVAAPTGATNNYAAAFTGGNVGIGTTSPTNILDVTRSTGSGTFGISIYDTTNSARKLTLAEDVTNNQGIVDSNSELLMRVSSGATSSLLLRNVGTAD
ncbi:MAG: hypothetical protein K2X47_19425, partial [Bdellovibrionales bacterium]|nr:hypothetical protein [Bdellovibrionales bacterium]